MKTRKILLAFALAVTTMSVNAQTDPGVWSMQIKGGFGASTLSEMEDIPMANGDIKNQATGAGVFGVDFEYQMTKKFSLSAGLVHTWQGGGWENFTEDNVKFEDPKLRLDYINVPILANFYVAKGFALKAGVQLGYLTNADFELSSESKLEGRKMTQKLTVDMIDDCKKFDVSIPVGLSYEFKSGIVIDARYNIGLTKVNKESLDGEKDSKNGAFLLSFGYKFKL